jgi:hypothetical protein
MRRQSPRGAGGLARPLARAGFILSQPAGVAATGSTRPEHYAPCRTMDHLVASVAPSLAVRGK